MFKSCPLLHDLVPQHAQIWTSFMQYKERVPVCGAVLINQWWDKVRTLASAGSSSAPDTCPYHAGPPRQGLDQRLVVVVPARQDQQGGARGNVCRPRGAQPVSAVSCRRAIDARLLTGRFGRGGSSPLIAPTGPRGDRLRPHVLLPARPAASLVRRARRPGARPVLCRARHTRAEDPPLLRPGRRRADAL